MFKYQFNTQNPISHTKISNHPPYSVQMLIAHTTVEIAYKLRNPGVDEENSVLTLILCILVSLALRELIKQT